MRLNKLYFFSVYINWFFQCPRKNTSIANVSSFIVFINPLNFYFLLIYINRFFRCTRKNTSIGNVFSFIGFINPLNLRRCIHGIWANPGTLNIDLPCHVNILAHIHYLRKLHLQRFHSIWKFILIHNGFGNYPLYIYFRIFKLSWCMYCYLFHIFSN